jgi:hypothetical protein
MLERITDFMSHPDLIFGSVDALSLSIFAVTLFLAICKKT